MTSDQQIKKKIRTHERDDKKIWITATKPADPTQQPEEAGETSLMSTGLQCSKMQWREKMGRGLVTVKRQFSMSLLIYVLIH